MASSTFRVLVLGDFHYGENYGNGGGRVLREHGYEYSTKYLRPFVDACDKTVINLETPLAKKEDFIGSFDDSKPYVHWADPLPAAQALRALGVDAVSLANNHTVDLGSEALEATFSVLRDAGISWFGAGLDELEAEVPYKIDLPVDVGGGSIQFSAFFEYRKSYDEKFGFYANDGRPGCARFSRNYIPSPDSTSSSIDALHIAFPHWGPNYVWRSDKQEELAQKLVSEGYDAVVGHGAHTLQEVQQINGRWVAYSVGNGNFQSGGRWKKYQEENGILPYGFWTILEVRADDDENRHVFMNLYPVYLDNRVTGYQPRPLADQDFDELLTVLKTQESFPVGSIQTKTDDLGNYLQLVVGEWPLDQAIQLGNHVETPGPEEVAFKSLVASEPHPVADQSTTIDERFPDIVTDDPNRYDDEDSQSVLREMKQEGRNIGTLVLARAARRDGANLRWYGGRTALLEKAPRRVLVQGPMATDTAVSAGIVKDKLLTKEFLEKAGAATPSGALARSARIAVDIQRRLGVPVVVKPRFGRGGKGITVNLSDPEEVRVAFRRAHAVDGRGVIVEEFIQGMEFRVLATPDRTVGAVRRLLPHVKGDGKSTIRELIQSKNAVRKRNPNNYRLMIPMDDVTELCLARQGLGLADVLSTDRRVIVRNVGGISGGGDAQECLDEIDDAVRDLSVNSIAAVPGMLWGGTDVLVSRLSGRPYVLELNTGAASSNSTYPVYGRPKDVGDIAWQELLDKAYVDSEPIQLPRLDGFSQTLRVSAKHLIGTWDEPVPLASLLKAYLRHNQWNLTQYALGVYKAQASGGRELWLKRCADENLPQATAVLVRNHQMVRAVLQDNGLAMPRAHQVKVTKESDTAHSRLDEELAVVRRQNGWASHRPYASMGEEEISGTLIQGRPKGKRIRVFASRQQVLMVLADQANPGFSKRLFERTAKTAIVSVRAIPGLRWGLVDIVVPARGRSKPHVEGMDMNGTFTGYEYIIWGNLEKTLSTVVGETHE